MLIEYLNGGTEHHHGPFILDWLRDEPGMDLRKQLDSGYRHGGGWRPFGQGEWELQVDMGLKYPGDPAHPRRVVITFEHSTEQLWVYDSAWFVLVKEDGSFEVCRMD